MHRGAEPLFTREMCRNLCQFLVRERMLTADHMVQAADVYNKSLGLSSSRLEDGAKLYVTALLSAVPEMHLGVLPGDFVRRWMWESLKLVSTHSSGHHASVAPVSGDAPTVAKSPPPVPTSTMPPRPSARQPQQATTPPKPTQEMIGRYPVEKLLAQGGMGAVYVGTHPDLSVPVAIKVIKPEVADDDGVTRFGREARALWVLNHPNLLRCYDVDLGCDRPYIVMPFVKGETLDATLKRRKPKNDLLWRVELMRDTARGVGHMHVNGMVHRDLKPKNIFVDEVERPIVGDPGLVKRLDVQDEVARFKRGEAAPASVDLTQVGTVMGTIPYMAPEQGAGDPAMITPAADVYSLGKIVFEVATMGVAVHSGTQPMAILAKVFEPEIPRIVYDELKKKVYKRHEPQRLIDIVVRCLQFKPEDRYKDANALADALDAYATWLRNHEAEEERKRQADYEAIRRRNKIFGAFAGLGILAAVFAFIAYVKANEAKTEAEARAVAEADARSKAEALAASETRASAAARLRVMSATDLGRAQTLVKNAQWVDAESILLGVVSKDETYAPARMLLADVQFNLLKASCVDHWLWLATNGPEQDRARNSFLAAFGQQQLAMPTPERSTASIAAVITEQPYATLGQVLVRLDEADACRQRGNAAGAVEKMKQARSLADSADVSPESEWIVSFVRGRVLYQGVAAANLGPQKPPDLVEACRLFERSALLNPDFGLAWFFFGDSAKLLGEYRTAQTAFLRGQMMVPQHAAMRYMYADTLIQWAGEHIRTRQAAARERKPVPPSIPDADESLRMLVEAINLCRNTKEANAFQNPEQRIVCSLVQINGYVFRYVGLALLNRNEEAARVKTEAAQVINEVEGMPGLRQGDRETLAVLRQRLGL